jgi:hypothetical protein
MKHLLPQVFPRDLCSIAVPVAILLLAAGSATAQANSNHERHRHPGHEADAALHIEVRIVSYTMTPSKHHRGDNDDAAVVYELPLRQPAMNVVEEEHLIVGRVAFGQMVIDAGPGALLKTTTVVPE